MKRRSMILWVFKVLIGKVIFFFISELIKPNCGTKNYLPYPSLDINQKLLLIFHITYRFHINENRFRLF